MNGLVLALTFALALVWGGWGGWGCDRRPSPSGAGGAPPPAPKPRVQITVFAAASTAQVLQTLAPVFSKEAGVDAAFSFEASSTLAKQIKAGAPADLFISADERWMDDVSAAGLLKPGSRQDLLGSTLVMVAPAGKGFTIRMDKTFDFTRELPGVQRIALADPAHVPAGRYARASFEWLGWWKTIEPRMLAAQDVRAALRLVEAGEADAGVVYATDARSDKVVVAGAFPPESHPPIRYPIALTIGAKPEALAFLQFLRSPAAVQAFQQASFTVIPAATAPPQATPPDPGRAPPAGGPGGP